MGPSVSCDAPLALPRAHISAIFAPASLARRQALLLRRDQQLLYVLLLFLRARCNVFGSRVRFRARGDGPGILRRRVRDDEGHRRRRSQSVRPALVRIKGSLGMLTRWAPHQACASGASRRGPRSPRIPSSPGTSSSTRTGRSSTTGAPTGSRGSTGRSRSRESSGLQSFLQLLTLILSCC